MECVVHYEGWEYECCGEPFKLGDEVVWDANLANDWFENFKGRKVDYSLFFHIADDELCFKITGKIVKIEHVYVRREERENKIWYPVEYKFNDGQNSDDYTYPEYFDLEKFNWNGFLITLEVSSIEEFKTDKWS